MTKVLVHLEPLWFRGSPTFVSGHYEVLIKPILKALLLDSGPAKIAISSNVFLCLDGVKAIRDMRIPDLDVSLYQINSTDLLKDVAFSVSDYCSDIFSTDESMGRNQSLFNKLGYSMDDFGPDVVITTSQNRYLKRLCKERSIPLIFTEFGPLPRQPYRDNRFISLDGHLSDGMLCSAENFRAAMKRSGRMMNRNKALLQFEKDYKSAIELDPKHAALRDLMEGLRKGETVAVLALQPEQWITWEGPLSGAYSPATIVLRALAAMRSDKLVVVFHPDPSGNIPDQILTELWLSNPNLVRLPKELGVGTTETILPYVDELVTVSSNVAVAAFLLGKKVTSIGNSFARTLSLLSEEQEGFQRNKADLASYLFNEFCVMDGIFRDPTALRAVISKRVKEQSIHRSDWLDRSRVKKPKLASTVKMQGTDDLAAIHANIQQCLTAVEKPDDETMFEMFGRNYIGYAVPKGSVGVELGVAAGYFSRSLLMSGHFETLYSVDAWGDHHDEAEYTAVCSLLGQFGAQSKVLRATFDEAMEMIPDDHLDFIYVDAYAHTGAAANIIRDWRPKLKKRSTVAGHDYSLGFWPLNYHGINNLAEEDQLGRVVPVPGVLTANSEDVFPSFVIRVGDTKRSLPLAVPSSRARPSSTSWAQDTIRSVWGRKTEGH